MPKPRGQQKKRYKINYRNSTEDPDLKQPADWTRNNYHQNWLYLSHARKRKIEEENNFIKTKNIKHLKKAKLHNYKAKKILFEGLNLYEETVDELHTITTQIALELYPEEKELIGKNITKTAIQELQLYSSLGETSENPIEIERKSDFSKRFEEYLDTPKINKDPTVPLEELTQPPLSEEEKQQRLERLQVLKEEVDTKYSELDLYILALAAQAQQTQDEQQQQQQSDFAVERPVATESFQPEFTNLISENTRSRKRQRLGEN